MVGGYSDLGAAGFVGCGFQFEDFLFERRDPVLSRGGGVWRVRFALRRPWRVAPHIRVQDSKPWPKSRETAKWHAK